MLNKILLAVLMMTALVLGACGGSPAANSTMPADYAGKTNPLGAQAAAAGAEVFKNNCEVCHGPQGHGDGPAGQSLDPQPKNLPELAASVGDDYLFWRVSTGKDGAAMVGWKGVLTAEQIWQVVAFIRALK